MNVKNGTCIRRLSFRMFWAARKRNCIATVAIALTALLFTSIFTIALSINSSYEMYAFRQIGGYSHGVFKEVTVEQAEAIAVHPNVKASGICMNIGAVNDGIFSKDAAEISYMDDNCTKWAFAEPKVGRMPESGKEISMDTRCLELLGIQPEIGAEITLTYLVGNYDILSYEKTDTFTLVGWWEYDKISPVHYINISEEYADSVMEEGTREGIVRFRRDLTVMMASGMDIEGQMMQVNQELGYTWDRYGEENNVPYDVNWGYTTVQVDKSMDISTIIALTAFLVLVIFTGYLIIYNVFQISVTGDIRFYGLLKTIGVTPRQLRRIIRYQALLLCLVGIPAGLLLGYWVGGVLTPVVIEASGLGAETAMTSSSPLIFLASALFALGTVLLSCFRPGRMAGRVSPVEATKYTEGFQTGKISRTTRGAGICQMAFANLGRNKSKTVLVVVSLSFTVVLLNVVVMFVRGFDMEKYLTQQICADFVVGSTDYFKESYTQDEYISQDMIEQIAADTTQSLSGCGYTVERTVEEGRKIKPVAWMTEESLRMDIAVFYGATRETEDILARYERRGNLVACDSLMEGLDTALFEKLMVVEGDLEPLFQEGSNAIAMVVHADKFGNVTNLEYCPELGAAQTITYIDEAYYIDSRTGERVDVSQTPGKYWEYHIAQSHDVEYTICAYVVVPESMGFGYRTMGYSFVLPVERMAADSQQEVLPMVYVFDTPDSAAEKAAEEYLSVLTDGALSELMYESKATIRAQFESLRNMTLILGGVLCAIIGLTGILNYFNAVMTGILSRKREFAVLQAVGMTNKQLKAMLIYEGLFYALGSAAAALLLSIIWNPLIGTLLEKVFWFFSVDFTIAAVLAAVPVFVLLGWLIPSIAYGQSTKYSVVERLREDG